VLLKRDALNYFNTRDVAAIAICAALWGVLNSIFAPVFFSMTHLPFFCDLIGFSVLTLTAWWIRKFGAITIVGAIGISLVTGLDTRKVIVKNSAYKEAQPNFIRDSE
jgi:hypothetical protein